MLTASNCVLPTLSTFVEVVVVIVVVGYEAGMINSLWLAELGKYVATATAITTNTNAVALTFCEKCIRYYTLAQLKLETCAKHTLEK